MEVRRLWLRWILSSLVLYQQKYIFIDSRLTNNAKNSSSKSSPNNKTRTTPYSSSNSKSRSAANDNHLNSFKKASTRTITTKTRLKCKNFSTGPKQQAESRWNKARCLFMWFTDFIMKKYPPLIYSQSTNSFMQK